MELWQVLRRLRSLLPPRLATVVLRSDRSERCHVLFQVTGAEAWGGGPALAAELTRAGRPATVWWQAADGVPRAMAGAGEAYPATVFEQVHPAMGDRVRAHAVAALGPVAGRRVWDLYAGVGETTAALVARRRRRWRAWSRTGARWRKPRHAGPPPGDTRLGSRTCSPRLAIPNW